MQKLWSSVLLFILFILVIAGCNLFNNDTDVNSIYSLVSEEVTFSYSAANPVYVLPASPYENTAITIEGSVEGKELFLVKANMSGSAVDGDETGRISSMLGDSTSRDLSQSGSLENETGRIVLKDYAPASDFNANPPPVGMARDLSRSEDIFSKPSQLNVGIGNNETFWVQNAAGSWISIDATCRAVGAGGYSAVWVPDINFNDGSTQNNDNRITTAQAEALAEKFDGTSAQNWEDGIYKGVTTVFGYEYGGGPSGSGGVDGDDEIHMLLYDIDYDYSPSQSSYVVGYFWAKDFYDDAVMQSEYGIRSNEAEIFYLDVHFFDQYPDGMYSTMAHEFQHMIHFNKKWVEENQDSPTWFNEMCSQVAEDFLYSSLGTTLYDSHPTDRLTTFESGYVNSGATDWGNTSNVLENYASSYFFGAYLARNYGGAALFNNLLENSYTDIQAVEAALAATGNPDQTFELAFLNYTTALVYSTPPSGSAVKYFSEVSENYGGIDYTLPAFNINHTGGLETFDPSARVDLRPYGVSIHTNSEWSDLPASSFTVSIERGSN